MVEITFTDGQNEQMRMQAHSATDATKQAAHLARNGYQDIEIIGVLKARADRIRK